MRPTEIHRLLEGGLRKELSSVTDTTAHRDNLATTTVNSVGVKLKKCISCSFCGGTARQETNTYSHIENVEPDATHVFLSEHTLLRGPLEGSHTRVLDLVEVLNTLRDVDKDVGASGVGTEAPDLTRVGDIPAELVGENTRADLVIVTSVDLAVLDGLGKLLLDRLGLGVETVVLVLRLRQGNHRGLGLDGLTIRDDGVGDLEGNTGVVLLEILRDVR